MIILIDHFYENCMYNEDVYVSFDESDVIHDATQPGYINRKTENGISEKQ